MTKIAAVVVTYNRVRLLKRCLDALDGQSIPLESIIVINNNSTDETKRFLERWHHEKVNDSPNRVPIHLKKNTGGAGGFNRGIRYAIEAEHDWVWTMDDDVIPIEDALEELIHAAKITSGESGFYSSIALDESMKHTVNVPAIDTTPSYQGYAGWGQFLPESIVKIQTSTFVSLLISHNSIMKIGLPIKEFFIWGDDTEYTRRMTRNGIQGYWIGRSRVIHLRPGHHGLNIRYETDPSRIHLYKFLYRNWTYISRTTGSPPLLYYVKKSLIDIVSLFIKYKSPIKSFIIIKGLILGIFFAPTIETISTTRINKSNT